MSLKKKMPSVAIIGAGASGLIALKRVLEQNYWHDITVFEQSDSIGGTWIYTSNKTSNQQFTAMYKNLRTNLPKDCMGYLDYPFPEETPTFFEHKKVRKYLESFVKQFNLNQYIQFNSKVIKIEPIDTLNPYIKSWNLFWNLNNHEKLQQKQFDHIIVCNGHYNKPFIPEIKGIQHFKGKIIHSKSYDSNDEFKDKNIIIIGNGVSAIDIGYELIEVASEVHHCKRTSDDSIISSKNLFSHSNIKEILENGDIITNDSSVLKNIDYLIYCTGYYYDYPFLNENIDKIFVQFKSISDLFSHIVPFNEFHPQYFDDSISSQDVIIPTIAFIGLPQKVLTFPLFDVQSLFITSIWANEDLHLPSVKEIKASIQNDLTKLKKKDEPLHHLHFLGLDQFNYYRYLLFLIKKEEYYFEKINTLEKIFIAAAKARIACPDTYKDFTLMNKDDSWYFDELMTNK